ncbi:MAG: hypothetical protein AAGE03_01340 [Pseudomonadota bacterium]
MIDMTIPERAAHLIREEFRQCSLAQVRKWIRGGFDENGFADFNYLFLRFHRQDRLIEIGSIMIEEPTDQVPETTFWNALPDLVGVRERPEKRHRPPALPSKKGRLRK